MLIEQHIDYQTLAAEFATILRGHRNEYLDALSRKYAISRNTLRKHLNEYKKPTGPTPRPLFIPYVRDDKDFKEER